MVTTPTIGQTPWGRFRALRRRKGLTMAGIEERTGMGRSAIRQMLMGNYGHPATPEKKGRLLGALNEGPGDPVAESDIWSGQPDAPAESA